MFSLLTRGFSSPPPGAKIFKDECPFSFETLDQEGGLYICMKQFIGIGPTMLKKYSNTTHSDLFLHYVIRKQILVRDSNNESQLPTKLALGVPGGFELPQDGYTITEHWTLVQVSTGHRMELPNPIDGQTPLMAHLVSLSIPEALKSVIATIQIAKSAVLIEERASGVSAWENEDTRPISKFSETLQQLDHGVRVPPSGWKCSSCGLRDNLWLNLTDGSINCGRRFWDGTGGNNHAIDHYNKMKYPLAVKLGTVTAEGADIFSYEEDCMVTDPKLAEHLAHFGIDIMRMHKTDKSLLEMEVAANERLGEWVTLQESDHVLQPRFGPGLTGLLNLGNSCYMNTVLQVLFAIPNFRRFYAYRLPDWIDASLSAMSKGDPGSDSFNNNGTLPVDDVGLQFAKLGYGLCSGLYSIAPDTRKEAERGKFVPEPSGIRPLLFRRLLGRNHAAFATKQQQDAFECFVHILDMLDATLLGPESISDHSADTGNYVRPRDWMRLAIEDRIECGLTHKVRYVKHDEVALSVSVPLEAMVNRLEYEAYRCRDDEAKAKGTTIPEAEVVRPRIPLSACLTAWAASERIEDFRSPSSSPPGELTHAFRSNRLLNCPDYLCIQVRKYTVGEDWLPRKLDVEIELDCEIDQGVSDYGNLVLDLSTLRSSGGPQPGEELMPDETSVSDDERMF